MTDIVDKAKRLGLHGANLHQILDRVDELQMRLADMTACAETFKTELDAAQAREKVRIEALIEKLPAITYVETRIDWLASEALRLPSDDTALKALLVAELKVAEAEINGILTELTNCRDALNVAKQRTQHTLSVFAQELECTEYERIDAIIRAIGD